MPVANAMQSDQASVIHQPGVASENPRPLADLPRPDGSLDLTSGFSGAIDPTGYSMMRWMEDPFPTQGTAGTHQHLERAR